MANTQFKKGQGGRKPGATNKLTRTVKETVLEIFNNMQEDPKHSLETFAKKNPRDFYLMAAKLIPTEISGSVKQKQTVRLEIVRKEGSKN
jgi:hypothetical protein